jgi:small GTP-binding protein
MGLGTYLFKVVIAGDGGVGKTTLLERYVSGTFNQNTKMTIGANFHAKELTVDGEKATIQVWDFAGQERFRTMLPSFCLGARGALVCYDLTDYQTFENAQSWLEMIRNAVQDIPIVLVGCKYDLDDHEVEIEIAEDYASKSGCICNVMCSSKDDINVADVFIALTEWMIYRQKQKQDLS